MTPKAKAPTSPLGAAIDQVAAAEQLTELERACAAGGAVIYRPFAVPVGEARVAIAMRVLSPLEELEATAEYSERIRSAKILPDWLSTDTGEQMRARCYLARACRDPADTSKPAGPPAAWWDKAITPPVVGWLWVEYADLLVSHDPFGAGLVLVDPTDLAALALAVEKKSPALLVALGPWKQAALLLTLADQLSTSRTPPSSDGSAGTASPSSPEQS